MTPEPVKICFGDSLRRRIRGIKCIRKRLAFGISKIIHKIHGAEWSEDHNGLRIRLDSPMKTAFPVFCRSSKLRSRLLDIDKRCIKRRHVPEPDDNAEKRLFIKRFPVIAGAFKQPVKLIGHGL